MKLERWQAAVVGVGALVLAGMIFLTSGPRAEITAPEWIVRETMSPFEKSATWVVRSVMTQFDKVRQLRHLQRDHARLQQEVAELREAVRTLKMVAVENERLRRLVDASERVTVPSTTARVIARDHHHWFDYVTIDRGARDGLAPGMGVIDADGAVGHIENVTNGTAKVLLMTDTKSAVGGVVFGRDIPVLVEGTGDPSGRRAVVRALVAGNELYPGDLVVTSGLSLIFPPGILIGVVEDVQKDLNGLKQRASMTLAANLQYIDWVTVLLHPAATVEREVFALHDDRERL